MGSVNFNNGQFGGTYKNMNSTWGWGPNGEMMSYDKSTGQAVPVPGMSYQPPVNQQPNFQTSGTLPGGLLSPQQTSRLPDTAPMPPERPAYLGAPSSVDFAAVDRQNTAGSYATPGALQPQRSIAQQIWESAFPSAQAATPPPGAPPSYMLDAMPAYSNRQSGGIGIDPGVAAKAMQSIPNMDWASPATYAPAPALQAAMASTPDTSSGSSGPVTSGRGAGMSSDMYSLGAANDRIAGMGSSYVDPITRQTMDTSTGAPVSGGSTSGGWGQTIGSGLGGLLGAGLGSFAGPIGSIAGGYLGSQAGGWAGNQVVGLLGQGDQSAAGAGGGWDKSVDVGPGGHWGG
jgi:hypothetical protein